jgi:predicted DNA-binding transcriptional regulator AlpA
MRDCLQVPGSLVDYQFVSSQTVRRLVGGISRRTMLRWIRAGYLPLPVTIGGRDCWRVTVIRAWLERHIEDGAASAVDSSA